MRGVSDAGVEAGATRAQAHPFPLGSTNFAGVTTSFAGATRAQAHPFPLGSTNFAGVTTSFAGATRAQAHPFPLGSTNFAGVASSGLHVFGFPPIRGTSVASGPQVLGLPPIRGLTAAGAEEGPGPQVSGFPPIRGLIAGGPHVLGLPPMFASVVFFKREIKEAKVESLAFPFRRARSEASVELSAPDVPGAKLKTFFSWLIVVGSESMPCTLAKTSGSGEKLKTALSLFMVTAGVAREAWMPVSKSAAAEADMTVSRRMLNIVFSLASAGVSSDSGQATKLAIMGFNLEMVSVKFCSGSAVLVGGFSKLQMVRRKGSSAALHIRACVLVSAWHDDGMTPRRKSFLSKRSQSVARSYIPRPSMVRVLVKFPPSTNPKPLKMEDSRDK